MLSVFFFYAPELHLRGMRGSRVLLLRAKNPSNRAGIRLYRFYHM